MFHVSRSTVHGYTKRGLLPAPEFHGNLTTYDARHVERLRAIRHLLHVERLSLAKVKRRLAKMSDDDVRKLGVPEALTTAEPIEPPGAPPAKLDPNEPSWRRRTLLPGLELHVQSGASAFVQRIAEEIEAKYKAKAREEA